MQLILVINFMDVLVLIANVSVTVTAFVFAVVVFERREDLTIFPTDI